MVGDRTGRANRPCAGAELVVLDRRRSTYVKCADGYEAVLARRRMASELSRSQPTLVKRPPFGVSCEPCFAEHKDAWPRAAQGAETTCRPRSPPKWLVSQRWSGCSPERWLAVSGSLPPRARPRVLQFTPASVQLGKGRGSRRLGQTSAPCALGCARRSWLQFPLPKSSGWPKIWGAKRGLQTGNCPREAALPAPRKCSSAVAEQPQ